MQNLVYTWAVIWKFPTQYANLRLLARPIKYVKQNLLGEDIAYIGIFKLENFVFEYFVLQSKFLR